MRETPRPSCLASENCPLELARGTVGAGMLNDARGRDGSGVNGAAVTTAGGGGGGGGTGLGSAFTSPVVGTAAEMGGLGIGGDATATALLRRKSTITRYGL